MAYTGPIIDCDLHHARRNDEELLAYLPAAWKEYITGRGRAGLIPMTTGSGYYNPHGFQRADSYPVTGEAGSDYNLVRDQLLDRLNVRRAFLTYGDDIDVAGHHNPYFAAELARALNDWTVDCWLSRDERLVGSILVATQLPELAANEIRRHATNPRMAQVLLAGNALPYGFGHPLFHPILEAAAETGRPVAIHAGAGGGANPAATAAGAANLYIEFHTLWPEGLMTHLVSLIAQGVFEKLPDLRVLLMEGGLAWVPGLIWRFDSDYKGLRREVPWLKKLPSEYFRDHIWLTTQPFETSPKREQMIDLMRAIGGDEKLVFATDYPHWDADEVDYVSARIPADWHERVFYRNAMRLYGWSEESVATPPPPPQSARA